MDSRDSIDKGQRLGPCAQAEGTVQRPVCACLPGNNPDRDATTNNQRVFAKMWMLGLLTIFVPMRALPAQQLQIASFALHATDNTGKLLEPGGFFEAELRVKNHTAGALTYVLRTVVPMAREDAPPALGYYEAGRRFAFLSEKGSVQLADGGLHDIAPEPNVFRVRLSTAGWKPGSYELGLFAHNSTDKKHGPYVRVCAHFAVEIGEGRVRLVDRYNPSVTRIQQAGCHPEAVWPGEATTLSVAVTRPDIIGLEVAMALRMTPERVVPGFRYDAVTHTASLADPGATWVLDNGAMDTDPAPGRIAITLQTTDLKPGLYLMTVTAHTDEGHPDAQRIALRVKSPADCLAVTVSEPWPAWEGSSAGRFTRLPDGTLMYGGRLSVDRGRTWLQPKGGGLAGGCPVLKDGRVLALDYSPQPRAGQPGWYGATLRSSSDGGRLVLRESAALHVPLAKAASGHAQHQGPLCTGSFVQRDDGVLLALMMGWFIGDDALCPYGRGRPYSRAYVCESRDGGRVWNYFATIGYDRIGSEGYNEGSLVKLPGDEIVAVLRTGNMTDVNCQDNPVMVSRSNDGGRTWLKPWHTGVNGAYPGLALLSDGLLALSAGRPGAYLLFSADRGDTWHDLTLVDGSDHSGYTTLIETAPGELLVAFGEGYVQTGIENRVRMATVHYRLRLTD